MASNMDDQLLQYVYHLLKNDRKDITVPIESDIHPFTVVNTVQEVKQMITKAKKGKKTIRVVGSTHSVVESIFPENGITLKLEGDLRGVTKRQEHVDPKTGKKYLEVRVGAGCNIGVDPDDPSSDSANSLAHQINSQGYALPITGGIIYQTVGGFLSTGSAGGSVQHGFADCIGDIEFIDGNGNEVLAKNGSDEWCAVGVSMGLFGVITYVTLQLPETFYVQGTQETKPFDGSEIDPKNIENTLKNQEYFRANWFPQQGVNKVTEWAAKRVPVGGKVVPYQDSMSNRLVALGASTILCFTSALLEKKELSKIDLDIIEGLLDLFLKNEDNSFFRDYCYKILPQDNKVPTDNVFPVQFTEIWLPVEDSSDVINRLQEMFKDPKAAGNFATEIYSAKKSPFWLSMSHDRDCIRVDAFWFKYNYGDVRKFYQHFWKTLLNSKSRLHWGKFMPNAGEKVNDSVTYNLAYLKSLYSKLDDWLKMRKKFDPNNLFLNEYWKNYFEIE